MYIMQIRVWQWSHSTISPFVWHCPQLVLGIGWSLVTGTGFFCYDWSEYNLPDEASPGGDWLSLKSQIDCSSLSNDSSLCSFSKWCLKQFNDSAQTVSPPSLLQMLIFRWRSVVSVQFLLDSLWVSENDHGSVHMLTIQKNVSNLTEDKPCIIL